MCVIPVPPAIKTIMVDTLLVPAYTWYLSRGGTLKSKFDPLNWDNKICSVPNLAAFDLTVCISERVVHVILLMPLTQSIVMLILFGDWASRQERSDNWAPFVSSATIWLEMINDLAGKLDKWLYWIKIYRNGLSYFGANAGSRLRVLV